MFMTILIRDALSQAGLSLPEQAVLETLSVVLHTHDTLVVGVAEDHIHSLLASIAEVGRRYGMELHWSKFQSLEVNQRYKIRTPEGEIILPCDTMSYLCARLYSDGRIYCGRSRCAA